MGMCPTSKISHRSLNILHWIKLSTVCFFAKTSGSLKHWDGSFFQHKFSNPTSVFHTDALSWLMSWRKPPGHWAIWSWPRHHGSSFFHIFPKAKHWKLTVQVQVENLEIESLEIDSFITWWFKMIQTIQVPSPPRDFCWFSSSMRDKAIKLSSNSLSSTLGKASWRDEFEPFYSSSRQNLSCLEIFRSMSKLSKIIKHLQYMKSMIFRAWIPWFNKNMLICSSNHPTIQDGWRLHSVK